jgi:hypothetical protein
MNVLFFCSTPLFIGLDLGNNKPLLTYTCNQLTKL